LHGPVTTRPEEPVDRRLRTRTLAWLLAALLLGPAAARAQASASAPPDTAAAPARTLVLDGIELEGTARTSLAVVQRYLPLRAGQAIDQAGLVAAVDELRRSSLFERVDFYTRPGAARGHLVLVLEVKEHDWDFRWAAGNTDLDGWYLVPAMLVRDNLSGHGDVLDLKFRIGFRHVGLFLDYERPRLADPRNYFAARLSTVSTDRPWFADGVEFRHQVQTNGVALVRGRRFSTHWLGEAGLKFEGVHTADYSRANTESADGSIRYDQKFYADQLPAGIRDGLGDDTRAVVHLDLQHDTRAARLRAGSPVGGFWGRLKLTTTLQGPRTHVGTQADFRGYRECPGGVLALRLRGALVTDHAAFYDRLYLGGMYTVRGFPTYSLSAPGGDTWLTSGSLEYRTRILGDARGTKLAGVLFADAGAAGGFDGHDPFPGVSVGAGYGVRWRVWWLDWLGVDVGFPVTKRPLDQRFQVTASIGWSF